MGKDLEKGASELDRVKNEVVPFGATLSLDNQEWLELVRELNGSGNGFCATDQAILNSMEITPGPGAVEITIGPGAVEVSNGRRGAHERRERDEPGARVIEAELGATVRDGIEVTAVVMHHNPEQLRREIRQALAETYRRLVSEDTRELLRRAPLA